MSKKLVFLGSLVLGVMFLSACTVKLGSSPELGFDGGVYVSPDKGENFRALNSMPTITGTPGSIDFLNVNTLVMDPSDHLAVYLGSEGKGMYYTYNVTKGWYRANGLPDATINDIAIDPKDKCNIYVAVNNKVYKSTDCNRNFKEVYFDSNTDVTITALAIDHFASSNIYLGTSRGDVLKSVNGGTSWKAIQRLDVAVRKIVVHPKDSRLVYVASSKNGIYRFNSGATDNLDELQDYKNRFDGTNWMDLNGELKEFDLGFNFKSLVFCPADSSMLLATDKVILRSTDNGVSWAKLKLVTPDKDSFINAAVVNPKNSKEIYYVTNTTFYKSIDGGDNWIVKQLPTSKAGNALIVDFQETENIYMGVKKFKS